MEIKVITKFEDFLSLENIWNGLLEKSQSDDVCLTFEWYKSWWLAFGKDRNLLIILLKDNNTIKGIVPLTISRLNFRGLPVREIGFMQNDNSPRSDFILPERREEALDTLIQYLKDNHAWDLINFANIPQGSPNYRILQKTLTEKNMLFGIKEGLRSPFIQIQSDWQTYLSSRSKEFRKHLRKNTNRMSKLGPYAVEKIEGTNNNGVLDKIFDISKRSWKSEHKKDITGTSENKRFFEELSKAVSEKKWLNIWLLNVNGTSIAYEYHLRYKDKIYALRADFDKEYEYSSPGSVLDTHIMQATFEGRIREYDMCGDNHSYKQNWTSLVRNHANFIIYRDSPYGKLLYSLEFKIISFLKRFEFLKKLKTNLTGNIT